MGPTGAAAIGPVEWNGGVGAPPILTSRPDQWSGGRLSSWRATGPQVEQPALDHHYVVLHMGGAKRVHRRGDGASVAADVEAGALTVVPAGSTHSWRTEGPIEFAHCYLSPRRIQQAMVHEFDRDARGFDLLDGVGRVDPLLSGLFAAMLAEVAEPGAGSRLYIESLAHAFTLRLLRGHSTLPDARLPARHALAPQRLRRVLDFIEAHLGDDIGLAELAGVACLSPYHFTRAFGLAVGEPPYAYLLGRRIECAKRQLLADDRAVAEIARSCGFKSATQFATIFRQRTGLCARQWRAGLGSA